MLEKRLCLWDFIGLKADKVQVGFPFFQEGNALGAGSPADDYQRLSRMRCLGSGFHLLDVMTVHLYRYGTKGFKALCEGL